MSDLESPGANSSQGWGGLENGESSNPRSELVEKRLTASLLEIRSGVSQDDLSSFGSVFWEDIASEDDLAAPIDFASSDPSNSTRNDLKRKATFSNHKGVHFKQRNKKFVARLCLPGGKSRKLELGEYNTHDEAARAYQVGAFYYNKSSTSNCGEDNSFLETLPCAPDDLSDAGKLAWVRERARHSAASIGRGNSFDARPSAPASYGTQGSCDDNHSTPTTPTTAESTDPDNSFGGFGVKEPYDWRRRYSKTRFQGSPNSELQLERKSNALTNQMPVVDHQVVSQVKMTDSILFALCELRRQGWEWTLKLRSPRSVEAGVLFSLPKGQHAAPALCITDIITNSFHELREQGWEVHLQPHGRDKAGLRSELREAPTEGMAQDDKTEASKFSAHLKKVSKESCTEEVPSTMRPLVKELNVDDYLCLDNQQDLPEFSVELPVETETKANSSCSGFRRPVLPPLSIPPSPPSPTAFFSEKS